VGGVEGSSGLRVPHHRFSSFFNLGSGFEEGIPFWSAFFLFDTVLLCHACYSLCHACACLPQAGLFKQASDLF
jgi:hypothetical protein